MNKVPNYDLPAMRVRLIELLAKSLNKGSKWYKDDYENIVHSANSKTRKELVEALERWNAVVSIKQAEINRNCQV